MGMGSNHTTYLFLSGYSPDPPCLCLLHCLACVLLVGGALDGSFLLQSVIGILHPHSCSGGSSGVGVCSCGPGGHLLLVLAEREVEGGKAGALVTQEH